jgi:hypoxanthine-guanine phosphoribosyltransferase
LLLYIFFSKRENYSFQSGDFKESFLKTISFPKRMKEEFLLRAEAKLKQLNKISHAHAKVYDERHIGARNFFEWAEHAKSVKDADEARNALYYGFQPLFDDLVNNDLNDNHRPQAVQLVHCLSLLGTNYLTDYYLGDPNLDQFKKNINCVLPKLRELKDARYYLKERNIDDFITVQYVHTFLKGIMEHILDETLPEFDYVIGCACGATEAAMPIGGLLNLPVGFIRRSRKRGDRYALIVDEQLEELKLYIEDKTVLCVEDWIDSGKSMKIIMDKAAELGAAAVYGASVGSNDNEDQYAVLCTDYNCKLYKRT